MSEMPRKVTEREIFDTFFLSLHKTCMNMACEEAKEASKAHNIPIECFNISALTFQLWQKWLDNKNYIKTIRNNTQKALKI